MDIHLLTCLASNTVSEACSKYLLTGQLLDISAFLTFAALILAIFQYVTVNKYLSALFDASTIYKNFAFCCIALAFGGEILSWIVSQWQGDITGIWSYPYAWELVSVISFILLIACGLYVLFLPAVYGWRTGNKKKLVEITTGLIRNNDTESFRYILSKILTKKSLEAIKKDIIQASKQSTDINESPAIKLLKVLHKKNFIQFLVNEHPKTILLLISIKDSDVGEAAVYGHTLRSIVKALFAKESYLNADIKEVTEDNDILTSELILKNIFGSPTKAVGYYGLFSAITNSKDPIREKVPLNNFKIAFEEFFKTSLVEEIDSPMIMQMYRIGKLLLVTVKEHINHEISLEDLHTTHEHIWHLLRHTSYMLVQTPVPNDLNSISFYQCVVSFWFEWLCTIYFHLDRKSRGKFLDFFKSMFDTTNTMNRQFQDAVTTTTQQINKVQTTNLWMYLMKIGNNVEDDLIELP